MSLLSRGVIQCQSLRQHLTVTKDLIKMSRQKRTAAGDQDQLIRSEFSHYEAATKVFCSLHCYCLCRIKPINLVLFDTTKSEMNFPHC